MGVNSPTGPGGPAPSGGSTPPPTGGPPEGKPAGTEGGPPAEGAPPPGGELGLGAEGDLLYLPTALPADDAEALNLIKQAGQAMQMNLAASTHVSASGVHAGVRDSAADHHTATEEGHTERAADSYESSTLASTRVSDGEALASGDRDSILSAFSRFNATARAAARGPSTGGPPTSGPPVPGSGTGTGTGTPVPLGGNAKGAPTGTGTGTPTNPPIFPNTTDPRLANLSTRTPTFVPPIAPRDPSRPPTPEQELETQLRAALSGSPPDEEAAKAALENLAGMGFELAPEQETDDVGDRAELELAEGEGEGDAGRLPGGAGGESEARPRMRAIRFDPDRHLPEGVAVLCGGGRGDDAMADAAAARTIAGLELVCGGNATAYASSTLTTGAVHGTYAEGDGSGDGSGTGGGSNPHDPVGFGSLADPSGSLAASGYGIIETPGPMGNFAVLHTATGRVYGMDDARLPAEARPGVRSWMAIGREVRANAMSGISAGRRGDIDAGARC